MGILMSVEIKEQISKEIRECKNSLLIITGFCKIDGMDFIENNIVSDIKDKRILVRFRMDDIISSASDLQLYEFCKEKNWKMHIRFDLHAKTYIFDKKRCILGSANLTNSGLGLSKVGNYEVASICDVEESDLNKINHLFDNAVEMNDNIYLKMQEQVNVIELNSGIHPEWSKEITKLFKPTFDVLFTYDFPDKKEICDFRHMPIEFLDLKENWVIEQVKESFRWCKSFLWLYSVISNNGGEMYFGELTANLHNALINDPKPYRKEVKELLQNLLQWIQDLEINEIAIDRPNHSQRIRISEQPGGNKFKG